MDRERDRVIPGGDGSGTIARCISRVSRSPRLQYLERFERAAVFRPAGWRATVRSVHDGRVGASVEEQVEAADAVMLCRQMHGDRIDAMAFTAPVIERADLLRFAETSGLKKPAAGRIVDEVVSAVANWPRFAAQAGVTAEDVGRIAKTHRLALGAGRV